MLCESSGDVVCGDLDLHVNRAYVKHDGGKIVISTDEFLVLEYVCAFILRIMFARY